MTAHSVAQQSPAAEPSELGAITIDTLLAAAIQHREVWDQVRNIVSSARLVTNPFHRRIVTFADDFVQQYDKLPNGHDWTIWFASLPSGMQRDGTREAIQRLLTHQVRPTPEYLTDAVRNGLRDQGAALIRVEINAAPHISLETIRTELDEVEVLLAVPPLTSRWPTLGQVMTRIETPHVTEDLVVAPRLAWQGRHSLLVGLAKLGKSTLMAHAAGAVTRGAPFFDGVAAPGLVLWLGMDESRDDAYPRLIEDVQARRHRVRVEDPNKPLAFLREELTAIPDGERLLVVIDSLIEYARRECREVPASGDSAGWSGVVRPLTKLAHDDPRLSIVTLHHSRRVDGRYRDSGEIVAAVDALVTMLGPGPGQDDTIRKFDTVGRRSIVQRRTQWAARLERTPERVQRPDVPSPVLVDRERYVLVGDAPADNSAPTETHTAKQRATLDAIPVEGATWSDLKRATGHNGQTLRNHLRRFEAEGLVAVHDDKRYRRTPDTTGEHVKSSQ